MKSILPASSTKLRQDLFASVVVFLIALPFSMGVALACGAPIGAGLIPGAVAAIVAGAVGGAPFVVTGPAASVAVLVFEVGEKHGLEAIGAATLVAGLLQLLLGTLRVGKLAASLPLAVVHGMLASVGLLMAAGQARVLFGESPGKDFFANLASLPHLFAHGNLTAAAVGALALGILLLWPKLNVQALPASLVAIGAATAATLAFGLDVPKIDLPEQMWQLAWPQLPGEATVEWLGAAVAIGLIASTESLLSAVAVDKLHDGPRAQLNRELLGQGAANLISGLLGGLPVTGGSVRSTANLQAKAQSRLSTVMHGVWLVVAASFLADVLEYVPLAALAALLVTVSMRLVNWRHVVQFWHSGDLATYLITAGAVVGLGLLWGIGVGLAVHFAHLGVRRLRAARPVAVDADAALMAQEETAA